MSGQKWTDKEKQILRTLWPQYVLGRIQGDDITGILKGRTWDGVVTQAGALKLTNQEYDTIDYEALKRLEDQLKIKVI